MANNPSFLSRVGSMFGYQFSANMSDEEDNKQTFSPKETSDGALEINQAPSSYAYVMDLTGGPITSEIDLINKYREMSEQPEIDEAISQICNEAIITADGDKTVDIVLDDLELEDSRKTKIEDNFRKVLKLLNFHNEAYECFRRWYVDGRMYYHAVIDPKQASNGIVEMRYLDPRQTKKVRVNAKKKDKTAPQVTTIKTVEEYFVYNPAKPKGSTGGDRQSGQVVKIHKDAIVYCTSGITNRDGDLVVGYLHKALKFMNVLRAMEDATVIHRVSRAPDRRMFNVEVGGVPRAKIDQFMRNIVDKHRTTLRFNSQSGEIRDSRNMMTMIEDYYFPTVEGKGTSVSNLQGLGNSGNIDDVEYFNKKLMRALGVPIGRLDPDNAFNIGRSTQISRDEIMFSRFIDRLRNRFSNILLETLGKQLCLTGFCTAAEWEELKTDIKFRWRRDVVMEELKDLEMATERLNVAERMREFAGSYTSHGEIRRKIFRQTEEDIKRLDSEIADEVTMPQYNPPITPEMGGDGTFPDQGQNDPPPGAPPASLGPPTGSLPSPTDPKNKPNFGNK